MEKRKVFAAFSGADMRVDGEVFEGGSVSAVFGGATCDLRGAIFTGDCTLKVTAVCGGVEILAPAGVQVKLDSFSLFGGTEDRSTKDSNCPYTLHIQAICLFGGVDVH